MLRSSALKILLLASAVSDLSAAQVVTISAPGNNSQFQSPAHFIASATSPQCPQGISGMRIYLAPHVVAYKVQSNSIDTQLTLTPGNYKTVVQAWDACGGVGKTAVNFTVTPKGLKPVRFVYVADGFWSRIVGFTADPQTGALSHTAQRSVRLNSRLAYLAADRGGNRLYATDADFSFPRGQIYAYFIDRRNGYISPIPGGPFRTDPWPAGPITVHPSGKFVFVSTASAAGTGILIFAVKPDGSLTAVNTTPVATNAYVKSLLVDHSGKYLYAMSESPAAINAFEIDTISGALTPVPGSPFPVSIPGCTVTAWDMAESYGRFLYTSDYWAARVSGYHISGKTGTLDELSGSPFPAPLSFTCMTTDTTYPLLLATEPSGRFLYAQAAGSGSVMIFSIDAGNGALKLIKTVSVTTGFVDTPTADPSGKFLYYTQDQTATGYFTYGSVGGLVIDPANGDLKVAFWPIDIGPSFSPYSNAIDIVATP